MTVHRVLVVDDQPEMREMVRLALHLGRGWDVVTASSGPEALEVAVLERPDAILLDAMMPGMDGLATFEHLRLNPATQTIPVVLLTAGAQTLDALAVAEFAGVIHKPFQPLRLAGQVAILLGWSSE